MGGGAARHRDGPVISRSDAEESRPCSPPGFAKAEGTSTICDRRPSGRRRCETLNVGDVHLSLVPTTEIFARRVMPRVVERLRLLDRGRDRPGAIV